MELETTRQQFYFREALNGMERALVASQARRKPEHVDSLFQAAHAFKGSHRLSSFADVKNLALEATRDGVARAGRPVRELLLRARDHLSALVRGAAAPIVLAPLRNVRQDGRMAAPRSGRILSARALPEPERRHPLVGFNDFPGRSPAGIHHSFGPFPGPSAVPAATQGRRRTEAVLRVDAARLDRLLNLIGDVVTADAGSDAAPDSSRDTAGASPPAECMRRRTLRAPAPLQGVEPCSGT